MALYKTGQFIIIPRKDGPKEEYRVDAIISDNAFGELYSVSDTNAKNRKHLLRLFYQRAHNSNAAHFDSFCKNTLKIFHQQNLNGEIFNGDKQYEWTDISKNKLYAIVYPEIKTPFSLGDRYGWNEETFSFTKKISELEGLGIVKSVSELIFRLHRDGIIHTYISPDTIFPHNGGYKLTLPGFAHLLYENGDKNITSMSGDCPDIQVFPLAPELIINRSNITAKADVWSLGILLAVILGNKVPFYFSTEKDYIASVKNGSLQPDLSEVPEKYKKLISHALVLDHSNRIDAEEFIKSLDIQPDKGFVFDSSSDWYSIVSPQNQYLLPHPGDTENLHLQIMPGNIPGRTKFEEEGKTLIIEIRGINAAANTHPFLLKLPILPKPVIRMGNDNACQLTKVPVLVQGDSVEYQIQGVLKFQVLRSIVHLTGAKVTLELSAGAFYEIDDVKSDIFGKNIAPRGVGDYEQVHFTAPCENIPEDEPIRVRLELLLANHKSIELETTIIPRFPPYLSTDFRLLGSLRSIVSTTKEEEIRFKNIGGKPLIITDIFTENLGHFVTFPNQHIYNTTILPRQDFTVRIKLDAANIHRVSAKNDFICFKYYEAAGSKKLEIKKFPFDWQIVLPNRSKKLSIDFGTSTTCACVEELDGGLEMLQFPSLHDALEGAESVPSYIYYSAAANKTMIGVEAKNAYDILETNAFNSIKKYIAQGKAVFVSQPSGGYIQKSYEDLVKDYLKTLLQFITTQRGTVFDEYIFTHPTNITSLQKTAFSNIVNSLGLGVANGNIKYIDEATCGALDYLRGIIKDEEYFLVYDFGGGTTDIVFAKIENKEVGDALGNFYREKHLIPIFSKGQNLGGDDINYEIIQSLRRWYYLKNQRILPYIHPSQFNTVPAGFIGNFNIWSAIQNNSAVLWKLADDLKKKVNDIPDEIKIQVISDCKGTNLDYPASWDFIGDGSHNAAAQLFLKKDEINLILREAIKKIGNKIQVLAHSVLEQVYQTVGGDIPFTGLLMGRSSRFPIVEQIFNYLVHGEKTDYDFLHSYTPFSFHPECTIGVPNELKHVVARGALELLKEHNPIIISSTLTDYGIYIGNNILITPGKRKLPSETDLLSLDGETNAAYYIGNEITFHNALNLIISKKIFSNEISRFNIFWSPPQEYIDKIGHFCLFVDDRDEINWRIVLVDGTEIGRGILN